MTERVDAFVEGLGAVPQPHDGGGARLNAVTERVDAFVEGLGAVPQPHDGGGARLNATSERVDAFVESLRTAETSAVGDHSVADESATGECGLLNFYHADHDPGGWRALRLRRWLALPRADGPVVLFVGISPGIHGAAVSGVPFACMRTFFDSGAEADADADADDRLSTVGRGTDWEPVADRALSVSERAATNFWSAVAPAFRDLPMPVTWNAVPFWSFETRRSVRRNRSRLLRAELQLGARWLHDIMAIYDFARVVAVGATPARALHEMGIAATRVSYPSNRWRDRFRDEVRQITDELRRDG